MRLDAHRPRARPGAPLTTARPGGSRPPVPDGVRPMRRAPTTVPHGPTRAPRRSPVVPARSALRPGALLAACRLQLATLQDRLAGVALPAEARAELEARVATLAAHIGQLAALRGHLVQVLLG